MGLKKLIRDYLFDEPAQESEQEKRFHQYISQLNAGVITGSYPYINNLGTYTPGIDYDISSGTAMRIATVFTCVLVRAESLGVLPKNIMQSTANGSVIAYSHPAQRLVHDKPNPFQTASDYWKSVSAHIDLYGNCFSIITYSGRYQPTRIDLIEHPNSVQILRTENGRAIYEYDGKRYQDYEILHFKDLSLDGFYGCSKISYNASTVGYASKLKTFGSNAIGTKPPGYFTTEQNYSVVKQQEGNLQKSWTDNIAEGKTPLLPFGLKYMNLQISPGDAQYLDAVGATKEDIYGIFRTPPTLAQNYLRATFANAEQQDLVFVKHTMLPVITNVEQECNAKLFSEANVTSREPYYMKVNVNAFMRGDFATRTQGYKTLWERGLITGNMVADLEDWNHFEGGDRRFIPMNMIPLDKLDEFLEKLNQPVNSNAGNDGGDPEGSANADSRNFTATREDILAVLNKKNGHKVNGHA